MSKTKSESDFLPGKSQQASYFRRKQSMILLFIVSVLLLAAALFLFSRKSAELKQELTDHQETTELKEAFTRLNLLLKDAELADRGYALSGDNNFLNNLQTIITSLIAEYQQIRHLENRGNNQSEIALFLKSDSLFGEKIAFMRQVLHLNSRDERDAILELLKTHRGIILADSITQISSRIVNQLEGKLSGSKSRFLQSISRNQNLGYAGMGIALLLVGFTFTILLQELRRSQKISEDLKIRKDHFRTALNSLNEGLITTNKDGQILFMNPAAERLTGWRWQEARLQPLQNIYSVVNEATGRPFENIVSRIVSTGQTIQLENNTLLKARNAKEYIISNNVAPLFDLHGNITGAIVVFSDITESKRAQELIVKEKELSDKVINSLPGIFYFYDESLKLLRWNKQLELVTGYSAVELGSMNPSDLFSGDDKIYMQMKSREVFQTGSGYAECCITAKGGQKIPYYFTGIRIHYEGKNALLGIGIDISERKKAEAQMRMAIERFNLLARATHDTVWDWDIVQNTMQYNEGMIQMFGYKETDISKAVNWWKNNFHPDDKEQIAAQLEEVFSLRKEAVQMKYRYRCADGSYKYIMDRALVLYDNRGNPVRMIGAMQDISWQIEEERRIERLVMEAQERERRYIGMELHDNVNQLLAASLMYLGMSRNENKSITSLFETVSQATQFINTAVKEIRKLSHQLAPASFKNVSLQEVFGSLVANMNTQQNWKVNIHFDTSFHDEIREDIKVNLYRILQEQLNNIHKYAQASKVEVDVRMVGKYIRLRIADNGVGFNPQTVKRGIGLENITRRTHVFNGRMQLLSAPGKGCSLTVEIPQV